MSSFPFNSRRGRLKRPSGLVGRKKSSFQVFQEFMVPDETGAIDANRLLSKECFNEWVRSRNPKPVKPDQGFRSAMIGHLAGTVRRQPFPEEVEKNLLDIVRKKKIWPCFEGTSSTVGIYGTKVKGYHEKRKKSSKAAERLNGEVEAPLSSDQDRLTSYDLYKEEQDIAEESMVEINTEEIEEKCEPTIQTFEPQELKDVLAWLTYFSRRHSDTPAGQYAASVLSLYGEYTKVWLKRLSQEDILLPTLPLFSMLNLNPDNDIRFKRSFLLPDNINSFDVTKPVGNFVLDKTMTIMQSFNAVPIFGDTGIMRPLQAYSSSQTEAAVHIVHSKPLFESRGWFWYRKIIRNSKNERKVILGHIKASRTGYIIHFQDITEHYLDLIDKPAVFL